MYNDYESQQEGRTPAEPVRKHSGFWVGAFLLGALLISLVGSVAAPVILGFVAGYDQLQAQNHENAIQHFQRGLGYLAENYPELAYTEFEVAVRYDPSYGPARDKLVEMQAVINPSGTPGAEDENRVADALFAEAKDLVAKQAWSDAIVRLEQLRTLKPDYRTQETVDLLYTAYVESGKAAVAANQIELARERFDAALFIRNGDPEVQRQRDLAALYLDAQQAVGYNWPVAIQKFAQLYQMDPKYDDVRDRLVSAYAQYGDTASKQGAWCLAVREYDGALAIVSDAQTQTKRAQAMAACRQAISVTPSPVPTTGMETYLSKISKDTARPCASGTGDVSGVVRDAFLQPLAGVWVAYYADGINRVSTRTNAAGQYQFTWGADPGLFHVIILSADGKTQVGVAADVDYPGANRAGCHVTVDWQRVQ